MSHSSWVISGSWSGTSAEWVQDGAPDSFDVALYKGTALVGTYTFTPSDCTVKSSGSDTVYSVDLSSYLSGSDDYYFTVQAAITLSAVQSSDTSDKVTTPLSYVPSSTVSLTTTSFDKYALSANYADISVVLTLNGNTLSAVKNDTTTLTKDTDYTVSGSTYTFPIPYLDSFTAGTTQTITFDMGQTVTNCKSPALIPRARSISTAVSALRTEQPNEMTATSASSI